MTGSVPGSIPEFRVPDDLTERDQWLLWRCERETKVPYSTTGRRASSTDPATWCSYDEALEVWRRHPQRWAGIGFVFHESDPFVGLDLDDSVDDHGNAKPWARGIGERFSATAKFWRSRSSTDCHSRSKSNTAHNMLEGWFVRDQIFAHAYPMARPAAGVRSAAAVALATVVPSGREDLEQEELAAVWRALPRYDPSRASLRTFVERVVAARFASLMRARRWQPSLEPLEEYHLVGLGGIPVLEFRTDFQRVSASLAERDRRLSAFPLDHSPTEASRALRISRSTVYEGIRRIRIAFADAGFGPRGRYPR